MGLKVEHIVGVDHMDATKLDSVILHLRQLPLPAKQKRYLFARWCLLTNCKATLAYLDQVAKLEA